MFANLFAPRRSAASRTTRRPLSSRRLRGEPLRERRLRMEDLEDRRLLAYADFELSSLLPANGGDGSEGFVVSGITDRGLLGCPGRGCQPLGDVNQDDYVIDGVVPGDRAGFYTGGGVGDINGDGIPDIAVGTFNGQFVARRVFLLFGGSANLAALDQADADSDGRIGLSTFDAPAADGTHGFVISKIPTEADKLAGIWQVCAAGDLNGDQIDDVLMMTSGNETFVLFGRDSQAGKTFSPAFELTTLLPANGGNGSQGFAIPPVSTDTLGYRAGSAGDVNNDGIGDILIADPWADVPGRLEAGKRPQFEARVGRDESRPMAPGWGRLSGSRRSHLLHTFFGNGPSASKPSEMPGDAPSNLQPFVTRGSASLQ